MTTATHSATRSTTGTRPLAWAVLAAAVAQVVAPMITFAVTGGAPGTSSSTAELLIQPAGWAFGIWGVIYTLALAQAIAVLVRGADCVPQRLQLGQLGLYLGGTLWIAMSATGSSIATALALLVMLVAAVDAVLTAARHTWPAGWFATLTRSGIGLYAGWVTAAFFLNLGTALVAVDVFEADRLGWQLAAVVVAGLTLLALTATTRIVAYAVAGVWALAGIAATGAANDDPSVIGLALVVAAALAAALLVAVRRPA